MGRGSEYHDLELQNQMFFLRFAAPSRGFRSTVPNLACCCFRDSSCPQLYGGTVNACCGSGDIRRAERRLHEPNTLSLMSPRTYEGDPILLPLPRAQVKKRLVYHQFKVLVQQQEGGC